MELWLKNQMRGQVILFIIIIAIATIGVVLSAGACSKESFDMRRVFADVLLVFLGFMLAVVWDVYKDYSSESKERNSIILMLKNELSENYATINSNLETINANLKDLRENKEVIRPLLLLKTDVWTSAQLRNTLFLKRTADLVRLVNLYASISIANEKIKYRENYRIFGPMMSDYNSRFFKIDEDVKLCLEKVLPLLKNAQDALDRIHKWKVEGQGFNVDNTGVVREIESKND